MVRKLTDADQPQAMALLAADPVVNCVLTARFVDRGIERCGGDVWGAVRSGRLAEVVFVGGSVMPAGGDGAGAAAIGRQLIRMPRRSGSVVGPAREVEALWRVLADDWGPARDERMDQPLLTFTRACDVAPDPRVRWAIPNDLAALYPAALAMFTEEVGVSPLETSTEAAYRARLMWLIRQRRVLCRTDRHGVIFKAEIAAVTPHACQIQGVWVRPDSRNRGIGTAAMAAVAAAALTVAPIVSLYVNAYNAPALRSYRRAGFTAMGTMASIHL